MCAGRSVIPHKCPRSRSTSSTRRSLSSSAAPSRSVRKYFVLFTLTIFGLIDIEPVTAMSLDRLGIDRTNEIQSENIKLINDENKNSQLIVEDTEIELIPNDGENDQYVLLPAGSKSQDDSVDKNVLKSDETLLTNTPEAGGNVDMVMMESENSPVILPVSALPLLATVPDTLKEQEKAEANKIEGTKKDENNNEPIIEQVFKNDKDIEDMDKGVETGDEENESEEEPETVVDMLADVVDEVEKEIETELVDEETDIEANKVSNTKDKEKEKWEATVEKLEEKDSEIDKEKDEIPLETAAIMEEILPEEIVEAMAIEESDEKSSEETIESEKNKNEADQTETNEKGEHVGNKLDENIENQTIGLQEDIKNKVDNNLPLEENKNKLEEPIKEGIPKVEVPKDDLVKEPENLMTPVEHVNNDANVDTSSKIDAVTNAEQPLNNKVDLIQQENESPNQVEEDSNEDIKDIGVVSELVPNELQSNEGEDTENIPETSEIIAGNMQSEETEKVDENESNTPIDNTLTLSSYDKETEEINHESTLDNVLYPPKETMTQVHEELLPPADDTKEQQNDKPTEMESIESYAQPLPPIKPLQTDESLYSSSDETLNKITDSYASLGTLETVPTTLTTILQLPVLQSGQQEEHQQLPNDNGEQQLNVQQQEMTPSDVYAQEDKGSNEQTVEGDSLGSLPATQMTSESSTYSAQDMLLSNANLTYEIPTLNNEKEQQKHELHNASEKDTFHSQLRRYDGAQVWRIVVQNDRDRRLADELQTKYGGQLWKEVKQEVDYLLKPQVLADAEKHIRAANLSRIVLIDNLQQVIEVENPSVDELADADSEKGYRLTWQAYHRLADIHEFYDYLGKTYPEICSVETIGYSLEKRPLKVLKISNGNTGNPAVWIDGGMHAREWISPASVTYIANQLAEGWEDLPSYMQNIDWYIHAVANPDGYEYTHTTDRLWRKNMRSHGRQCPGVDLNRNFGFKWGGKGTSANPCSQTYRGTKAFSEPETFYISKFISGYPRDTFQAYLSFHSYGQYILYPWGYDYVLTSDRSDLDRVARAAATTITRSSGTKYTVGPSAVTLYPAAGGSDDWAKGIANIKYTYTIEMGDNGRYGFILPASYIESNGKDAYTFVQTVARAISHDKRKRSMKFKF